MTFPAAVIQHLAAFGAPAAQVVPINDFFQCYDILLSHQACPLRQTWEETKAHLAIINGNLPPGENTSITRNCLSAAVADPQLNRSVIYLLTMLWGFGGTDKGGPAKLFVSTQTPDAAGKIAAVADLVLAGNLVAAFNRFCVNGGELKLQEVGKAFGTKFLFVAGMHLPPNVIRPLVFDGRIEKALAALRKQFAGHLDAVNFPWFQVRSGAEYAAYCTCIDETAAAMNGVGGGVFQEWDAYKLEQLLFEHAANIGQAPAANIAPAVAANAAPAQPANMAELMVVRKTHITQSFQPRRPLRECFANHNGIVLNQNHGFPNNTHVSFIVGGGLYACVWNAMGSIHGDRYPSEWFQNLGEGHPITCAFDPEENAIVVQAGH